MATSFFIISKIKHKNVVFLQKIPTKLPSSYLNFKCSLQNNQQFWSPAFLSGSKTKTWIEGFETYTL